MGTSAQSVTVGSPYLVIYLITMKQFVLLLVLASPLAFANAKPSYGVGLGPQCHTIYDTVTRDEGITITEPVCNTRTVTNIETRQQQQCSNSPVEECHDVPRQVQEHVCTHTTEPECHNVVEQITEQQCTQVPEEQCTQKEQCTTEEECTTQSSTVIDSTTTEECEDVVEKVCG